jgi:hypothetical protein
MAKGEKTLRQVLKGDLLTQINEIWRRGESYQDAQKGDNIQGKLHCKAVETNLGKLISDIQKEKKIKANRFIRSICGSMFTRYWKSC